MLEVTVVTQKRVLFKGNASRVIFPGEAGTFEVLSFHRPLLSRLLPGHVIVDRKTFRIQRGAAKVFNDVVTVLVETR